MLTTILTVIVIAIVLVLIVAAYQPDEFRVSRSTVLPAVPSVVFPHVNNLHNWETWSPWAKLDPNAKNSIEGSPEGAGAIMRWDGNKDVGAGSMTIIESRPNELIRIQLDFLKPFKATSTSEFIFKPVGDKTEVHWTMHGKNNFIGKIISLVMNCDKMVGGQFEQGFLNLKTVIESGK